MKDKIIILPKELINCDIIFSDWIDNNTICIYSKDLLKPKFMPMIPPVFKSINSTLENKLKENKAKIYDMTEKDNFIKKVLKKLKKYFK